MTATPRAQSKPAGRSRKRGRALQMWRGRTSDLPLSRDGADRFVPWLIAPMAYLAILALAFALSIDALAARWDAGLSGALTVELPHTGDPVDTGLRTGAVLTVLETWPGVTQAIALDRAAVAQLVQPWLGPGLPLEDLPLPVIIEVTLAPDAQIDTIALSARLTGFAQGAVVDDHGRWLSDVRTVATAIRLAALALVLLIVAAAVATVVFVTRAGLAIHRDVVSLLHMMGATDRYIAGQFQHHALALAGRGAVFGLLLALVTLLSLGWAADRLDTAILPSLTLAPWHWIVLALVPLALTVLSMATARLTVLRRLVRVP